MSENRDSIIYKICDRQAWAQAEQAGSFHGAPIDLQDGYIHFSAEHQTVETATKHFAGQNDLVLVAVKTAALGAALKWEVSRGGDLFPHLYSELPLSAVAKVDPLPLDADGAHQFPTGFGD